MSVKTLASKTLCLGMWYKERTASASFKHHLSQLSGIPAHGENIYCASTPALEWSPSPTENPLESSRELDFKFQPSKFYRGVKNPRLHQIHKPRSSFEMLRWFSYIGNLVQPHHGSGTRSNTSCPFTATFNVVEGNYNHLLIINMHIVFSICLYCHLIKQASSRSHVRYSSY